jgi:hypothetical protein
LLFASWSLVTDNSLLSVPSASQVELITLFTVCTLLYEGYYIRICGLEGSLGGVRVGILHPQKAWVQDDRKTLSLSKRVLARNEKVISDQISTIREQKPKDNAETQRMQRFAKGR